ncbi:type II secretion system protein [Herbaspirillum sp. GCM10030257]|uniref:type II secretion system protein n=1 Tax=Herbaspirillum sp. GCM10030257 TaxID=3273393 RepID=UPI00360F1055
MKIKQNAQSGFTLIELVMVIVILGILAATALPKFVDLKDDAATAAVEGVAGALGAASGINKAARSAKSTNGVAITGCADAKDLLEGGLDAKYKVTAGTVTGGTQVCTVESVDDSTKTADFTIHIIS